MKKVLCAVLAVVFLVSLSACGGNEAGNTGAGGHGGSGHEAGGSDPNLGLWTAAAGEMFGIEVSVDDMFGEGFTIELKEGGRCTINADGEKMNSTWTLEDGVFAVSIGDEKFSGTLADGRLTLENVMDSGVTLIFYKENSDPGAAGSGETTDAMNASNPSAGRRKI